MYYIGQEIMVLTDTYNYKAGDKFIVQHINYQYLYDDEGAAQHINNVAPSFTAGDTVWDTHSNTTFVVHHIVDDQVYSSMPGTLDGSMLRGRPISRVRSGKPLVTPATPHPDTERLDWLLGRVSWTTTPVTREDIDRLRGKLEENDGWIPWLGGTCPVDGDTRVIYKVRSRILMNEPRLARLLNWEHGDCAGDIMAYRVVKP